MELSEGLWLDEAFRTIVISHADFSSHVLLYVSWMRGHDTIDREHHCFVLRTRRYEIC